MENTQTPVQETPTNPKENRRLLWDALSKEKLYTEPYEKFEQDFASPENRKLLHDALAEQQLFTDGEETFTKDYFADLDVKKKDLSGQGSSLVAEQPATPSLPNGIAANPVPDFENGWKQQLTPEEQQAMLPAVEINVPREQQLQDVNSIGQQLLPSGYDLAAAQENERSFEEGDPSKNRYGNNWYNPGRILDATADVATSFYNTFVASTPKVLGNTIKYLDTLDRGRRGDVGPNPALDTFLKENFFDVSKQWEDNVSPEGSGFTLDDIGNPRKLASAIGSVSGQLSQILLTAGAGGGVAGATAVGALQGASESMEASKAAGLNDQDAALVTSVITPVVAILDRFGFEAIGNTGVVKTLVSKVVGSSASKRLSQNAVIRLVSEALPTLVKKSAATAGRTALGAAGEGLTEGLQNIASTGVKAAYDQMLGQGREAGQGNFGTANLSTEDVLRSAGTDAVLGAFGGGIASGFQAAAVNILNEQGQVVGEGQVNTPPTENGTVVVDTVDADGQPQQVEVPVNRVSPIKQAAKRAWELTKNMFEAEPSVEAEVPVAEEIAPEAPAEPQLSPEERLNAFAQTLKEDESAQTSDQTTPEVANNSPVISGGTEQAIAENGRTEPVSEGLGATGNQIVSRNPDINPAFQQAPKIVGDEAEIILQNGEQRRGRFVVVSANDILASHNEQTFGKTEGYPQTTDGKSINDRNYEADKNAQAEVVRIAGNLDSRIITDNPTDAGTPIITAEGIVVSGNNRTMSFKRALTDNPERIEQYKADLKRKARRYGIDPASIDSIENPILVRVDEDFPDYNTAELSKYNRAEKKEKSSVEKAIEMSRTIPVTVRNIIGDQVGQFDNLSGLYDSSTSSQVIFNALTANEVIGSNEIPKYYDASKKAFTQEGKALVENIMLGNILAEDAIRILNMEGMGTIRQTIARNMIPLTENANFGNGYDLKNEIDAAIKLRNGMKKSGISSINDYIAQLDLFNAEPIDPNAVLLNIYLEKGQTKFGEFIKQYNSQAAAPASGQSGLFGDAGLSKEEVVSAIVKAAQKNNKISNQESATYEQARRITSSNGSNGNSGRTSGDSGNNATPTTEAAGSSPEAGATEPAAATERPTVGKAQEDEQSSFFTKLKSQLGAQKRTSVKAPSWEAETLYHEGLFDYWDRIRLQQEIISRLKNGKLNLTDLKYGLAYRLLKFPNVLEYMAQRRSTFPAEYRGILDVLNAHRNLPVMNFDITFSNLDSDTDGMVGLRVLPNGMKVGDVFMNEWFLKNRMDHEMSVMFLTTILHEGIHKLTVSTINETNFKGDERSRQRFKNELTDIYHQVWLQYGSIAGKNPALDYSMQNVDEFLAGLANNPELITFLDSTYPPATPTESFFKRFVNAVVAFLKGNTKSKTEFGPKLREGIYKLLRDVIPTLTLEARDRITSAPHLEVRSKGGIATAEEQALKVKAEDKFVNFMEGLKVDTKGSLHAFGLIPALYNTSIDVVVTSYKAGKKLAEAIDDAIEYIKTQLPVDATFDERAYKKEVQAHFEKFEEDERNAAKASLAPRVGLLEEKMFGSKTKTDSDFVGKKNVLAKITGILSIAQEKTVAKWSTQVGDAISKKALEKAVNGGKFTKGLVNALGNLFQGFEIPNELRAQAEMFDGMARNRAIADARTIATSLRAQLVDPTLPKADQGEALRESLERIDRAMDPDFYKSRTRDEYAQLLEEQMGVRVFKQLTDAEIDEAYQEFQDTVGKHGELTMDDLTEEERAVAETIRELYDLIHDMNFAIGQVGFNTYLRNKGTYVARMYDVIEMPEDMDEYAQSASKKMEMGMYKKREDTDLWKLTNKIEDPVYMVTKRLFQTLRNKAVYDYSSYIVNEQPMLVSAAAREGFTKLGKGYGSLSDKYVMNRVAEDFKGFFFANDFFQKAYDFVKKYDQIALRQFYKTAVTVYNPGVQIGNMTGNVVFSFWAGIDPVSFMTKQATFGYKEVMNNGATYRYLLGKGLLKTDIVSTELQNDLKDFQNAFAEAEKSNNPVEFLKKLNGNNKAKKWYSMADDIAKVTAFQILVDQGLSPQDALNRVANAYQNGKRVGKLYDFTSRVPVLGNPFVRFGGDLMRIVKTNLTTRPLHVALFGLALSQIARWMQVWSGESDEEREIRESRIGFPSIPLPEAVGGNIPLSFKFKDKEFNVARFISPLYVYSSIDEDGEVGDILNKFAPLAWESAPETSNNPKGPEAVRIAKLAKDPLVAGFIQLMVDADFRGQPIADRNASAWRPSTASDSEKLANQFEFLIRSYGTPYAGQALDVYAAWQGKEDFFGRKRNVYQTLLRFLGQRMEIFGDEQYQKVLTQTLMAEKYKIEGMKQKISAIKKLRAEEKIDDQAMQERVNRVLKDLDPLLLKIAKKSEQYVRYQRSKGR